MTKFKAQNKSKGQIPNIKTPVLSFGICVLLLFCHLVFGICHFFPVNAYALNLDKLKVLFLQGDYAAAVGEGERLMASAGRSNGMDELYYILGASYLKNGRYLRASDIFEIILKEFKQSPFKEDAQFGLGDVSFLMNDFDGAKKNYQEFIKLYPDSKLKDLAFYRLSICAAKAGNTQEAKEYLNKIKQDPALLTCLNPLEDTVKVSSPSEKHAGIYYTVQVGSFSSSINASNLVKELTAKGYSAYVEEPAYLTDKKVYRVRVGKFSDKHEADDLEKQLRQEGYPTHLIP